jgi:hypothetical protein
MELLLSIMLIGVFSWIILRSVDKKSKPDVAPLNSPDNSNNAIDGYKEGNEVPFNFYKAQKIPAQGDYRITYTDQHDGLRTEKNIIVKRVYNHNGKFAIGAYCTDDNTRHSLIDEHIHSAIDLDTKEIVNSVARHAITQYEDSGEGRIWKATKREKNALSLLVFVCRADGRMTKAERAIIADYIKRWCYDIELEIDKLDDAIKAFHTINQLQFRKLIGDMKSSGDINRLRDIYSCARRIVATQRTIDPLEKASIEILKAAVNSMNSMQESTIV